MCTNTEGSRTCGDCPEGYSGDGESGCVDINECETDNGGCDPLSQCTNTEGARTCGACPEGYTGDGEAGCVDIDECVTDNGGCDALTMCTNTEGGRTCGDCPEGYSGDGEAGCVDVDECLVDNGGCDALTTCTNTPGGSSCGPCPSGFDGEGATECVDRDECELGTAGCDPLVSCTNTPGAFTCGDCPEGYSGGGDTGCIDVNECEVNNGGCDVLTVCTNTEGSRTCGDCPEGYSGDGEAGCVDVDECLVDNGGCDALTMCTNTDGARTCGACPEGYTGDGEAGCVDINECLVDNGGCDALTMCANTEGGRTCSDCPEGYSGDGEAGCVDVDECLVDNGGCAAEAPCINSPGAFACGDCPEGYTGDGEVRCDDINECATDNGGCEGTCLNEGGRRTCLCELGTTLAPDGMACVNVNECETNNGGCSDTCVDTDGGYTCSCGDGYELSSDGRTCRDINECFVDNGGCDPLVTCTNQVGASPTCGTCPAGYSADGDGVCVEEGTVPGGTRVVVGATDAEFDALRDAWDPQLPPDHNGLTPVPGVLVTTDDQRNRVTVTPEELRFPADTEGVEDWEVGRVIASLPSEPGSPGKNGFGFLRKVSEIERVGDEIVVRTRTAALEEAIHGELQMAFDPANARVVEWDEFDHTWAAENLYVDVGLIGGELPLALRDDSNLPGIDTLGSPESPEGVPLWGFVKKVVKAVVNFVKAAVNAVINIIEAIVPSHFKGSLSLSKRIGLDVPEGPMFVFRYAHRGRDSDVEFSLTGEGQISGGMAFSPRTSVGVVVPNLLSPSQPPFKIWMDIDAYFDSYLELDLLLEAALTSAGGGSGSELETLLNEGGAFAERALKAYKVESLGNPEAKPAGGWKKTLWLSKPSSQWILAGPVPVVFTQTFQLDLECGFEFKASLEADVDNRTARTFKFRATYTKGGDSSITTPRFRRVSSSDVTVEGAGEAGIACGLIPRVNAYAYDAVGVNMGLRGSLQAKASYTSTCENAVTTSRPDAEVALDLGGSVGIQFGGRLQFPGSSYAGRAGQSLGFDVGPFELYTKAFSFFRRTWEFSEAGLGYCKATCANGVKDPNELGVDCGGDCATGCGAGVACNINSDCADGLYCTGTVCGENHCLDGVLSGTETATDCGGSRCAPCTLNKGCLVPTDCESQACYVETRGTPSNLGVCVSDPCLDNQVSPGECGIDCGDFCGNLCPLGSPCTDPAQCESGIASAFSCVTEQCTNLTVDGGETDLDCGGDTPCDRCAPGKRCNDASDCMASAPICDPELNICYQLACLNEVKDEGEGDVDCGGSCEDRCQVGQTCNSHRDCAIGLGCNPDVGVCARPTCNDGWTGPFEGDVDCGGLCEAKCELGQMCRRDVDCDSRICFEGTCADSDCADRSQTGSETDVDCGGACNPCVAGRVCLVNGDCLSEICGDSGVCQAAACDDGLQNGSESDVDCGGSCPGCDEGEDCRSSLDCESLSCDEDTLTCVAATCDDGTRNSDEGDIDCGGSACAERCLAGDLCNANSDCASQACISGVCSEAHCGDNVLSGTETDVDCGGICAAGCADGENCAVEGDCQSGKCEGGQCAPPTCDDEVQNQNETDVDCGGACPSCNTGQGCEAGADCTSLVCDGGMCAMASCEDRILNGDEEDIDCGGACEPCVVQRLDIGQGGFITDGSKPFGFTKLGDKLIFVASEHNRFSKGREPWVTDGTLAGTFELVDINRNTRVTIFDNQDLAPFDYGSIKDRQFDRALLGDDILIFAAYEWSPDSTSTGTNTLWRTDGTREGTFRIATAWQISNLHAGQGRVYFSSAETDSPFTDRLWVTDGTAPGTMPVGEELEFFGRDFQGAGDLLVDTGDHLIYSRPVNRGSAFREIQARPLTGSSAPLVSSNILTYGPVPGMGGAVFMDRMDPLRLESRLQVTDGTSEGTTIFENPTGIVLREWFIAEDDRIFVSGTQGNSTNIYVLDSELNATLLIEGYEIGEIAPRRPVVRIGNTSFFAARRVRFDSDPFVLWKSDGTPEGTTSLSGAEITDGIVAANGKVYFGAMYFGDAGTELWTSDGTNVGTRSLNINLSDIAPASDDDLMRQEQPLISRLNDMVVFSGKTDLSQEDNFGERAFSMDGELFSTDGTEAGTQLFKNLNNSVFREAVGPLVTTMGEITNYVVDVPGGEIQIWRTDGTDQGTTQQLLPHNTSGVAMGRLGDTLLVRTQEAPFPDWSRVWALGEGAPVELHADPPSFGGGCSGQSCSGVGVTNFFSESRGDGLTFFTGYPSEAIVTDGTADGTVVVQTNAVNSFRHLDTTQTLFQGCDDVPVFISSNCELWSSDGTIDGTALLKDINPGTNSSQPQEFSPVLNGAVLFNARTEEEGAELWLSDGTADGTVLLKDINTINEDNSFSRGSTPRAFVLVGDRIFFTATTEATGEELYVSDGTSFGTRMTDEINPGSAGTISDPFDPRTGVVTFSKILVAGDPGGNMAFFVGQEDGEGTNVFATTGDPGGTIQLTDFGYPINFQPIEDLVAGGTYAFFSAYTPGEGVELWVTDGTPDGTHVAIDLAPGPAGSYPRDLYWSASQQKLYFSATDGLSGRKYWSYTPQ
ncbi:MAG: hypothetical protein CMH57_06465 [Myxococcales bacterium]|nr:hypothetical protein [Myxococcales bacterium]